MKKIKKLMILGLIVAFAAFLVFPSVLFAIEDTSYDDYATIIQIVPGECGEETIVCFEIDWGDCSHGADDLVAKLRLTELPGGCPGIVGVYDVEDGDSLCVPIGVIPKGDYLLRLNIYVFGSSTAHTEAKDEKSFIVGECDGIIGVEKVDGNGNILTGAGFTLYNSDKSAVVVAEKMVDTDGKVAFEHLPMGTYVVSETTVPGGHSGMADQTVVINSGNTGSVINVTATNTKKPPPEEVEVQGLTEEGQLEVLAATGQNPLFYIIGLLLFAIAGGLAFVLRAVRTKR